VAIDERPWHDHICRIDAVYPHHLGNIELKLNRYKERFNAEVTVPEGLQATFAWNGKKTRLKPNKQEISFEF